MIWRFWQPETSWGWWVAVMTDVSRDKWQMKTAPMPWHCVALLGLWAQMQQKGERIWINWVNFPHLEERELRIEIKFSHRNKIICWQIVTWDSGLPTYSTLYCLTCHVTLIILWRQINCGCFLFRVKWLSQCPWNPIAIWQELDFRTSVPQCRILSTRLHNLRG